MRWRSPRCQNMPFSFLRLDGGLFKLSFSQFSRCLLSLNNNSSAIVDSMNQKWFHHEWFYLSVTRLTASIFSVHHKHFSLPLQLETDFHNSGRVRTKKKNTAAPLVFRCCHASTFKEIRVSSTIWTNLNHKKYHNFTHSYVSFISKYVVNCHLAPRSSMKDNIISTLSSNFWIYWIYIYES